MDRTGDVGGGGEYSLKLVTSRVPGFVLTHVSVSILPPKFQGDE